MEEERPLLEAEEEGEPKPPPFASRAFRAARFRVGADGLLDMLLEDNKVEEEEAAVWYCCCCCEEDPDAPDAIIISVAALLLLLRPKCECGFSIDLGELGRKDADEVEGELDEY